MRALMEIIDAVMENQPATEEELRYTLVAYQALATFDRAFLLKFAAGKQQDRPTLMSAELEANESFRRWKVALAQDPKVYVGWGNDPANPACQRRRQIALKIFDKALKGQLPNQIKRREDEEDG